MYPTLSARVAREKQLPTLVRIHSHDDGNFITSNSDNLVDGSDTSSRQFREQDHSLDIVVFELGVSDAPLNVMADVQV